MAGRQPPPGSSDSVPLVVDLGPWTQLAAGGCARRGWAYLPLLRSQRAASLRGAEDSTGAGANLGAGRWLDVVALSRTARRQPRRGQSPPHSRPESVSRFSEVRLPVPLVRCLSSSWAMMFLSSSRTLRPASHLRHQGIRHQGCHLRLQGIRLRTFLIWRA